jgi:hypothetical protein
MCRERKVFYHEIDAAFVAGMDARAQSFTLNAGEYFRKGQ